MKFIFPTLLFFYFPFFTQLQTAFIIGTSYAIAKLAPKRDYNFSQAQDRWFTPNEDATTNQNN